jgi:hypothetical protein
MVSVPIMSQGCTRIAAPRSLEEFEQFRRVQVPVRIVRAIDVRTDLHALQTEFVHAAFQLADGQLRALQRHGADPGVVARVVAAGLRHVVVQCAMQLQRVVRLGPFAEHHGHRAQYLHLHAEPGVIVDADLRVPGLRPDLAEELAVLVDAVAAVVAVVDHRETGIAVLRGEVRPIARQVVGVGIDLQHQVRPVM